MMERLKEIIGCSRLTLEKLPAIRAGWVTNRWGLARVGFWSIYRSSNVLRINDMKIVRRKISTICKLSQVGIMRWSASTVTETITSLWTAGWGWTTRRKKEKICFSCTSGNHRDAECHSRITCKYCNAEHQTSICDRAKPTTFMTTTQDAVTYPTVLVLVNGVKRRALLDTGAESSCASFNLIEQHKAIYIRKQENRWCFIQRLRIYSVTIWNLDLT